MVVPDLTATDSCPNCPKTGLTRWGWTSADRFADTVTFRNSWWCLLGTSYLYGHMAGVRERVHLAIEIPRG